MNVVVVESEMEVRSYRLCPRGSVVVRYRLVRLCWKDDRYDDRYRFFSGWTSEA